MIPPVVEQLDSQDVDATGYRSRIRTALLGAGILTLAFVLPLISLFTHALGNDLHSHIVLIPFVSAYLLHLRRHTLVTSYQVSFSLTISLAVIGLALVGAAFLSKGWGLSLNDHLALVASAYVTLLIAITVGVLGVGWLRSAMFPVLFLYFLVPLPDAVAHSLEVASQHASSEVTNWFFSIAGLPFLRDGTVFTLPGITIRVAEECSGIRSSWVLLITSLVAADIFLRSPWRRAILVFAVIPLGLIRNGFRILVIGLLCVEIGPEMIDSIIHHKGGPFFFVLSLIPLAALAIWLHLSEQRAARHAARNPLTEDKTNPLTTNPRK